MTLSLSSFIASFKAWLKDSRANPYFRRGLVGAMLVVGLDQASKFWVEKILRLQEHWGQQIEISPIFDLTYVQNYGASFGMLAGGLGSRIILSILSLGISLALIIWLGRLYRALPAIGVALIIGGALGNLYDRVCYGYVVDFLDFSGLLFPWVFNVADAAINVGVGLLLLDAWRTRDKKMDG